MEVREVPSLTFDEDVSQEDKSAEAPVATEEPVAKTESSSPGVYVYKNEKQTGPYTVDQLRELVEDGEFAENDRACFDGKNWVTIGQVPGFAE